jgi:peptidoglycan/LPS O-acetylase OafA/YrhL
VQWLAIAAVVGFAYRHLQFDSPARRYLTTAIFPVYILHQTVIVVLAHSLQPANLYPPIEALLMVLVTLAACFLGYEVIRRVRFLRPLFGLAAVESGGAERATELAPRVSKFAEPLAAPQDTN